MTGEGVSLQAACALADDQFRQQYVLVRLGLGILDLLKQKLEGESALEFRVMMHVTSNTNRIIKCSLRASEPLFCLGKSEISQ